MPKPPPPGPCVHCCRLVDELTWDHVFPKAWYPDDTPENLEKWKIPACRRCNAEYGELEQDLLLRLGMSIGPEEAKATGIAEKVIRSIDPRAARDEKDRLARARRHVALGRQMIDVDPEAQEGVLPGFGPDPDPAKRSSRGVQVSKESLKRLGEKIVRGLTFLLTGNLISDENVLEVLVVDEEKARPLREIVDRHGVLHGRGPGIQVWRAPAEGDPVSAVYAIEIWGRLKLYATVYPAALDAEPDAQTRT